MGFIKAESQAFTPGPVHVGSSEDGQHGQFAFLPYSSSGFDHIHPSDLGKPGTSDGRSKVARACTECKSRKMRCDGGLPFCGRCTTHSRTKSCAYVDPPKRSPITRQYVSSLETQLEQAKQMIANLEASSQDDTSDQIAPRPIKAHSYSNRRPGPAVLQNRSLTGDVVSFAPPSHQMSSKKRNRTSFSSHDNDHITSESMSLESVEESGTKACLDGPETRRQEDLFGGGSFVSLSSCSAALQIASQLSVGRQSIAEGNFQSESCTSTDRLVECQRRVSDLDISCETLSKAANSCFGSQSVDSSIAMLSNADCSSWNNECRMAASGIMEAFFEFHHPSYPILHPATFRAQLDGTLPTPSSPGWYMLVNMVFALGAFERKTTAEEANDDEHFFQAAKGLYSSVVFEKADIIAVQALTLMANYCQKKNFFSNSWAVLGSAVRMAISLGLHSESALQSKGLSVFDVEFGRRLWHTLFTMEADTCISMARPNGLLNINADVAQPKNVDESAMSPTCDELPAEVNEATISSTLSAHAKFAANVSMPLQARLIQGSNPSIEEIREFDLKTEEFIDDLPIYMSEDFAGSKPAWFTLASSRLRWRCNNFRMVMFRPFLLSTAVAAASARQRSAPRPTLRPAVKQAVALCRQMAHDNIHSISEFWDSHPHNQAMAWHAIYFLTQSAMVPLVSLLDDPDHGEASEWIVQLQTCAKLLTNMGHVTPIGAKCKDAIETLAGGLLQVPVNTHGSMSLSTWMSHANTHAPAHAHPSDVDSLMWSAHLIAGGSVGSDDQGFSSLSGHPTDPSLTMSIDSASSDGMSAAFDFVRGVDGSPGEAQASIAGSLDQWANSRLSTSSQWSDNGSINVPNRDAWFGLQAVQAGSSHHDDGSASLFGTSEPSATAIAAPQHQQPPHQPPPFEWHTTTDPSTWWSMQYKQETSSATDCLYSHNQTQPPTTQPQGPSQFRSQPTSRPHLHQHNSHPNESHDQPAHLPSQQHHHQHHYHHHNQQNQHPQSHQQQHSFYC